MNFFLDRRFSLLILLRLGVFVLNILLGCFFSWMIWCWYVLVVVKCKWVILVIECFMGLLISFFVVLLLWICVIGIFVIIVVVVVEKVLKWLFRMIRIFGFSLV